MLLDTNILVYAFDRSEDVKQRRARALLESVHAMHEVSLSAQVLAEFFHVATRRLRAPLTVAEAQQALADFAQAWRVLPIDEAVVLEAARAVSAHGLSYWDAQLLAVATLNDLRYLLSEDLQDGRILGAVRILNPLRDGFELGALA